MFLLGGMFLLILISACGSEEIATPGAEAPSKQPAIEASERGNVYATYDASKIGQGTGVLLFFKETGAVFSEASERVIRSVYASGSAILPTYAIELGTLTGMTLSYGVFVEDTVVLVDGSGKRRGTLAHPKAAELKKILTTGKLP